MQVATEQKLTVDLKKGDFVVFADIVDEVQSIQIDGNIVRVDVIRCKVGNTEKNVPLFWYAGASSVQNVQTK
jgi:hypothetical protein